MGKGDKKTEKGKRSMGSFGNTRKRKKSPYLISEPKKKTAKKSSANKVTDKKTTKKASSKKED